MKVLISRKQGVFEALGEIRLHFVVADHFAVSLSLFSTILKFHSPCQKVSFQVPIEHEFHHSVDGLVSRAHAQELDDVFVVESLHHVGFTEEVQLFLHRGASFQGLHSYCDLKGRKITLFLGPGLQTFESHFLYYAVTAKAKEAHLMNSECVKNFRRGKESWFGFRAESQRHAVGLRKVKRKSRKKHTLTALREKKLDNPLSRKALQKNCAFKFKMRKIKGMFEKYWKRDHIFF